MMAPHYEQARMLAVAIETAAHELGECIDRIEVTPGRVVVWAGRKRLAMTYYYANSYNAEGYAAPGSGHWIVQSTGPATIISDASLRHLASWLRMKIARLFS